MENIKKIFKFIIGIAVIITAVLLFFFFQKSTDLEKGNMKHWIAASLDRKISAVKILTGNEEHTELMVSCLNNIANIPDSGLMTIRDASSLCYTGILLKENI